jgi:hypothetical protein
LKKQDRKNANRQKEQNNDIKHVGHGPTNATKAAPNLPRLRESAKKDRAEGSCPKDFVSSREQAGSIDY